jgi:hypothetical protein
MPLQSRLRLIKRSRLYEYRGDFRGVPPVTRGVYVLYRERLPKRKSGRPIYEVSHIGVAGVATEATTGMSSRLKNHHKNKAGWTHYSIFEVHDNVRGKRSESSRVCCSGSFGTTRGLLCQTSSSAGKCSIDCLARTSGSDRHLQCMKKKGTRWRVSFVFEPGFAI